MKIAVASGKGGTGKTLLATSLALSLAASETRVQLLDCDVEAPNAHLFLKPAFLDRETVVIPVPHVDENRCTYCRRCAEVCAFKAISVLGRTVLLFPELCHGCGACVHFCPEKAISERERPIGVVEKGYAGRLAFVQGRLDVGEALAPPLIRRVKEHADAHATVILDAPPGTACPVVETVKGSDFCLLVTEPTPFGLHDLALAFEVVQRIGVPCGVVLNRAGMGDEGVAEYCRQKGIPLLLRLPFDREIAQAYARGLPLVEAQPRWRQEFARLAEVIRAILTGLRPGRAEPGE